MALAQLAALLPAVTEEINSLVETDYADAIHSNFYAPATEHSSVRNIIANFSSVIAELDNAIDTLTQSKSVLHKSLLNHSRSVSSVGRVPFEIMSTIFLHAVNVITVHATINHQGRSVAQNFAQVCRRWREIALATPRLWNLIHIDWRAEAEISASMRRPLALLSRSGSAPTHLSIFVNRDPKLVGSFISGCGNGVLQPFRATCAALEIAITGLDEERARRVVDCLERFPRLEQLMVTSLGARDRLGSPALQRLSRLQIALPNWEDVRVFFGLRWEHLESLVLTKSPVLDVGDLSERTFPSLQEVFLYTDQFVMSSEPFSLPKVRVFGFSYRDPSFDGPHIFDVAELPSLSTLVVTLRSETHLERLAQLDEQLCGGLSTLEVLLNPTTSWHGNGTLVSSRLPKASVMFKYHWLFSPVFMAYKASWYARYVPGITS